MTAAAQQDDGRIEGTVVTRPIRERGYVREPKLAGRHKQDVIREIAEGYTLTAIARAYDVGLTSILTFKQRYQREIDAVKERLDDDFIGLWIAKKRDRLAELEWMVEILGEAIEDFPDTEMIRVRAALMKQASEELGQLPPRQQVVSARVTHILEGVDIDDLK